MTQFTLILKSNLTKMTYVVNAVDDDTSAIYYVFRDVEITVPNGEYTFYLVRNEEGKEIEVNGNDPTKSTIDGKPVEVVTKGLAQMGKITNNSINSQYNGKQEYTQYRG